MVPMYDGNSEPGAHVHSNLGFSNLLKAFALTAVVNLQFFPYPLRHVF